MNNYCRQNLPQVFPPHYWIVGLICWLQKEISRHSISELELTGLTVNNIAVFSNVLNTAITDF